MNYALPLYKPVVYVTDYALRGVVLTAFQCLVRDLNGGCVGIATIQFSADRPVKVHYWHYSEGQVN